jgi:hypothetical protein
MPTETPVKPVEAPIKPVEVGLLYLPEKESSIGSASVGDAEPVRLLEIPIKVGSSAQVAGINPDGSRNMLDLPIFETLRLTVGTQFVKTEWWEAAKENPLVQLRLKWGAIVEIQVKNPADAGKLSAFEEDGAIQFVANCYDEDRLKGWLLDEARSGVRSQITARLTELRGDRPE